MPSTAAIAAPGGFGIVPVSLPTSASSSSTSPELLGLNNGGSSTNSSPLATAAAALIRTSSNTSTLSSSSSSQSYNSSPRALSSFMNSGSSSASNTGGLPLPPTYSNPIARGRSPTSNQLLSSFSSPSSPRGGGGDPASQEDSWLAAVSEGQKIALAQQYQQHQQQQLKTSSGSTNTRSSSLSVNVVRSASGSSSSPDALAMTKATIHSSGDNRTLFTAGDSAGNNHRLINEGDVYVMATGAAESPSRSLAASPAHGSIPTSGEQEHR